VSTRYVYVYERNASPGTPYIQTAIYQTNRDILDADVGDTDGDGDLEVVLLTGYAYSSTPSDIITLSSSLQSVGSFTLPWSAQTLIIEPAPPTSRKNLVVSRLVGVVNDSTIAIIDARSGSTVFESPPLIGTVQPNSVHYVTLPGETEPRMSIGTTGGMYLTR